MSRRGRGELALLLTVVVEVYPGGSGIPVFFCFGVGGELRSRTH